MEKKEVLKLRSKSNMVIAAAKTGNDINNKKETVIWATIKRGYWKKEKEEFIGNIKTVIIKFIEDNIELAPAKCKEKIIKSVDK